MTDRPVIAVVHPYWTLWEHTAGPTFRADRLELSRKVAGRLHDSFEVVSVADLASAEEGGQVGLELAASKPDVILVIVSMAVPPGYMLALLDALPRTPVVVWALHETGLVEGAFDHGGITTQGATVGAPMLTNMLSRTERPFQMVLGRMGDASVETRLREALRLASIAAGIGRARLGRIGRPIEGYLPVDGRLRLVGVGHGDKGEPPRPARATVGGDEHFLDLAVLGEYALERLARKRVAQVAHIDPHATVSLFP